MARHTSKPLDPEKVSSEVTLVWWQDAFDVSLPQEIERAAACIDWQRSADDVDLP